ncbi:MAG: cytochrome c [Bacteroidota bacterium]|nr:cytochrome c [Bacteroidota bacterium]
MKTKRNILFILLACIICSCGTQLYFPRSADTKKQEQLLAGRKLYTSYCSSCHNLHLPGQFTAGQWKMKVDAMQPRAKITDEQKQLILQYLISEP